MEARYSGAVKQVSWLLGLLACLLLLGGVSQTIAAPSGEPQSVVRPVLTGFLYGGPIALALWLLSGHRWALMGCVIYGTIGLALDIATLVQELTGKQTRDLLILLTAGSGAVNFLLITLSGRALLDVTSAERPPASHRPSPPPPSAS